MEKWPVRHGDVSLKREQGGGMLCNHEAFTSRGAKSQNNPDDQTSTSGAEDLGTNRPSIELEFLGREMKKFLSFPTLPISNKPPTIILDPNPRLIPPFTSSPPPPKIRLNYPTTGGSRN